MLDLGEAIAMADMGCGISQQLMSLFVSTAVLTTGYQWLSNFRLWTIPTGWLPWVAAVVGVEFAYY